MTRYLLDTDVLISFTRGRDPTYSAIRRLIDAGEELCTCPVVVAEFYSGIPRGERPAFDEFIDGMTGLGISHDEALLAGHHRFTFARAGTAPSTPDTLIAAVATKHGATVITRNLKDFPMGDVRAIGVPDL